jgi:hypothetical protein
MSVSGSLAADVSMLMARIFSPGSDYEDKEDAITALVQLTRLVNPDFELPACKARTVSGKYEFYMQYLSTILAILRDAGFYVDEPVADATGVMP